MNIRQFCTFKIGNRLFGVPVTDVREIHSVVAFTPVSHASEAVKGFVNIRGQAHLVTDLRVLLGFQQKETDDLSQIILFKPHIGESFGVLVDEIGDVAETDESSIETLGNTDQKIEEKRLEDFSDLIQGICKLEETLLVILSSGELFKKIIRIHLK